MNNKNLKIGDKICLIYDIYNNKGELNYKIKYDEIIDIKIGYFSYIVYKLKKDNKYHPFYDISKKEDICNLIQFHYKIYNEIMKELNYIKNLRDLKFFSITKN